LGFKPDLWPSPLAQQAAAGRHSGEFPVIFEKKKKKKKKKKKRERKKERKKETKKEEEERKEKKRNKEIKRGQSCPPKEAIVAHF
jgi:Ni/Co efflux regulator RcnB